MGGVINGKRNVRWPRAAKKKTQVRHSLPFALFNAQAEPARHFDIPRKPLPITFETTGAKVGFEGLLKTHLQHTKRFFALSKKQTIERLATIA